MLNAALAFPILALASSLVPPLVLTILPRYVNNETFSMALFSNIMGLLLVLSILVNVVLPLLTERPSSLLIPPSG